MKLSKISSADNIIFVFRSLLTPDWSTKYFNLIHADQLQNELETEEQQRKDIDSQIVRFETKIDFNSVENTANFVSKRVIRLV